jgi:hypothetical protein
MATSDLERLMAIEEIKQLRGRFARMLDTQNWPEFERVFAPDASLDATQEGEHGGLIEGAANIVAFISKSLLNASSVHHAHTPEIELTSATTAKGIWAMEDMLRWPEGGPIKELHGYGHYHETYERVAGQWRVKSFKLTRLRVDMV